MKRVARRYFGVILFLSYSFTVHAQNIELRGGRTLFPGTYVALKYEHYTNSMINVMGGMFMESSKRNSLSYSAFGVDLAAQYKPQPNENSLLSFSSALGATAEVVNEPWVYKDRELLSRLNYGLLADVACVLPLTEVFSLSAFVQQKYYFKPSLGTTHFGFGIGIKFSFSNY